MLFFVIVLCLLIGIGLLYIGNRNWDYKTHKFFYNNDDQIFAVGTFTTVIAAFAFAISLIMLIAEYSNVDAWIAKNETRYEALIYKAENCKDEFGLLSKEVIDEIQDWNEDLSYMQKSQKNFWCGIYYANIYDEFRFIDYELCTKQGD